MRDFYQRGDFKGFGNIVVDIGQNPFDFRIRRLFWHIGVFGKLRDNGEETVTHKGVPNRRRGTGCEKEIREAVVHFPPLGVEYLRRGLIQPAQNFFPFLLVKGIAGRNKIFRRKRQFIGLAFRNGNAARRNIGRFLSGGLRRSGCGKLPAPV